VNVLHINNTSPNMQLVVTYLRHQIVGASGGTAFPNDSNYFTVRVGRDRTSGGSLVVPVNMNVGSGNKADVVVYDGNPTIVAGALEIDRWYTKSDGDMNTFNKEGALIIQPHNSMQISYTGDQTSGKIYGRVSFLLED